ncbi:STAS-like domain-containing protein [Comamonas sp. MYb396]|uniref:STAS-like domain-containing protein n=1 Tax=Comamonas sp. MYb396 TaxID=2745302 RepID=UPI0030B0A2ED
MTKILITETIGARCISATSGFQLFNLLNVLLSKNEVIELNFAGVNIFASPFFNNSIGRLYAAYPKDYLDRLIKFNNLTEYGNMLVAKVIENSQSFKTNSNIQAAIDEILKDQE